MKIKSTLPVLAILFMINFTPVDVISSGHPILSHIGLCEKVDKDSGTCLNNLDFARWNMSSIYVFTTWEDLKAGDKLILTWYSPDGSKVSEKSFEISSKMKTYNAWSAISPLVSASATPTDHG